MRGRSLADDRASGQRALGYVPQDIALYPDRTTRENLAFFGRPYGLRGRRLATRIREVLELVEIADRANERVETFSGGMKRRVNLAAGLIHEPEVLIVDEPTVGVDPQRRNAMHEALPFALGMGRGPGLALAPARPVGMGHGRRGAARAGDDHLSRVWWRDVRVSSSPRTTERSMIAPGRRQTIASPPMPANAGLPASLRRDGEYQASRRDGYGAA